MLQIGLGATAGTVTGNMALAKDQAACGVYADQVMGPFYPIHEQDDTDLDLTMLRGHTERAKGEVIRIRGKILDEDCNPVPGVFIEIWQANAAGRYNHVEDKNPAPLDPNFQSFGQTVSDDKGNYGFKTIKPALYPLSFLHDGEADEEAGYRTPHIHFKISMRGYHELITQCYFPGEPLNEPDILLSNLSVEEQERLTVVPKEGRRNIFSLNLHLRKVVPSAVDPEVLDTYVGQYLLKAKKIERTYTVTRNGHQLFVEIDEHFPKVEIRPLANGRFTYGARSDGKQLSFAKAKNGTVSSLTIHPKKGKDQKLKKIG
ncbi:hypothetical protein F7C95_16655 [Opitutia bacterium ISCC 51]|nr:hypothetical protein F7C95_16655 [Opitutae bacterium ISCC 51]QXD27609.1 hypothetical protein GA003_16555 [Opitutae bacterium ISCC 52]